MLAGDHRWQWEEWCDARAMPRTRIGDVKAIVADAFLAAREQSPDVGRSGSLLLDTQYARPQIDRVRAAGAIVGTPAEQAGTFPLEWGSADLLSAPPPGSFVKVLVKDRSDYDPDLRRGQFDKLTQLQRWCRAFATPLVVEVLVPRRDEPEATFEEHGRPAMLAGTIRDAYARGIEPEYWKVEGTTSAAGARTIDAAIAERRSRQIILGKNADGATIARWFTALGGCATPAGFAIGRSVFWKPGTAFLTGEMSAREAADGMTAGYLALIDVWHAATSPRGAARGGPVT
jgi:5-dehydro-2-deoxygluconokinase